MRQPVLSGPLKNVQCHLCASRLPYSLLDGDTLPIQLTLFDSLCSLIDLTNTAKGPIKKTRNHN
jgi:hypothetical protein